MPSLSLVSKFRESFPFYRLSVVRNFFLITQAILTAKSSNLSTVKNRVGSLLQVADRQPGSHYKRLIRFFQVSQPTVLALCIIRFGFCLLQGRVQYLVLDGTSWQRGQQVIHLLVLSMVYQGVAIPIYWWDLAKKGHSSQAERQALFLEALQLFDLRGKILLADREYIGQEWFCFLQQQGIDFVIRLPRGDYQLATEKSYSGLEKKALRRKRAVSTGVKWPEATFQLVICRNHQSDTQEPLLYWMTSLQNIHRASELYRKRWKIEYCFKCLKSNGFNLEAMNFKAVDKLILLTAVVVFAYVLCCLQGLKNQNKVQTKKYRNETCFPALSIFKNGLDRLNALLIHFNQFIAFLSQLFQHQKTAKVYFVQ